MWVAEGFLKPISGKSLEESAEEYLMDLIDRNLILVSERGALGGVKFCKIHDLLRDLCLREVRKEKFLCFSSQHSLNIPHEGINTQRRVVIHENASKEEYFYSLKSAPITRSLICSAARGLPLIKFRLLRVLKTVHAYFGIKNDEKDVVEVMSNIVNLRYLGIDVSWSYSFILPSSAYLIWNLQTLIVECVSPVIMPPEIWKMSKLRNVKIGKLVLPDPPSDQMIGQDKFMLWNLQTLLKVYEFTCRENVVKRILNVKKLKICWDTDHEKRYCLKNLRRLHKLESLGCFFYGSQNQIRSNLLQNLTFPHLLEKLTLRGCGLYWEDMGTKIGSLPHLQVLKLEYKSFMGRKWETVEGQFPSLKYLLVDDCNPLENWVTESTHFPRLELLILVHLHNLEEVPCGIGEISTLKSIELKDCGVSANISAQKLLEEQEEFGNEGLQVKVWVGESE